MKLNQLNKYFFVKSNPIEIIEGVECYVSLQLIFKTWQLCNGWLSTLTSNKSPTINQKKIKMNNSFPVSNPFPYLNQLASFNSVQSAKTSQFTHVLRLCKGIRPRKSKFLLTSGSLVHSATTQSRNSFNSELLVQKLCHFLRSRARRFL